MTPSAAGLRTVATGQDIRIVEELTIVYRAFTKKPDEHLIWLGPFPLQGCVLSRWMVHNSIMRFCGYCILTAHPHMVRHIPNKNYESVCCLAMSTISIS